MELAGGLEFDDGVLGHVVVPNITPDRQTGIGGWTQEQIVIAIREGRRPDGTVIGPPMTFSAYRELSDRDASAIAAYLRTLKPSGMWPRSLSTKSSCRPITGRRSSM
jgi:hypothetical protein